MKVELSYNLGSKRESFAVERVNGALPKPDFAGFRATDLVVSDQVQKEAAQLLTLGVANGFEDVPLLGDEIYDSNLNADYPEIIPGDVFVGGECAFALIKEGEEVPFGHVVKKSADNLQIYHYATGIQITKKAELFNTAGVLLDEWSRACGRAHNALRNSLRFTPIIDATLEGTSASAIVYRKADFSAGASGAGNYALEATIYATLQSAIKDASILKRVPTIILCNSADKVIIDEVVAGYRTPFVNKPALPITKVIAYDGDTLYYGGESVTYTGVTAGTVYLIRPKRGFFERRKQDLLIDVAPGDRSRLISKEIVADCLLGIQANVAQNVQKVTIPTS